MHTHGKHVNAGGRIFYKGYWKDSAKEGQGNEKWSDQPHCMGQFSSGSKHGRGVYTLGAGTFYEGLCRNDKIHGEGRCTFSDGHPCTASIWEKTCIDEGG